MDQLHTSNKVCGGCCAISLNTVDTESSVSPNNNTADNHVVLFTYKLTHTTANGTEFEFFPTACTLLKNRWVQSMQQLNIY